MSSFWKWLFYFFSPGDVSGKFLVVGPRASGKSTLLNAAKAYEQKDETFRCNDQYDATFRDIKKECYIFSIHDTKFAFYVPGDWGGELAFQTDMINKEINNVQNIVYCFDVHKLFSNDSIQVGNGGSAEVSAEGFSTAEYAMGNVRLLLERINKKNSVKNFIFLGTHMDLLKTKPEKAEIEQKLCFFDLKKTITLQLEKVNVCLVCGSWKNYKTCVHFWMDIADALSESAEK